MKSLQHINKYFLKYRWRLLLGILFVGISNYFAIDGFTYARKAIDFITINHSNPDKNFLINQLFVFSFQIIGLAVLSGLFLFFTRQTIIVMSRLIEYDLKNEIYEQYQRLDLAFYKRNNTGDMMNRISEDVGKVRMYVGPAVMYIVNTIFRFILTITVMLHVNAPLTLYVLFPLPFLAVAIYYVSQTINKKSKKIQEQLSDITTFAQEAFSGIRVLKAYGRLQHSANSFFLKSAEYRKRTIALVKIESLFQPIMIFLIGLSNIFIIYIGGVLVIKGSISYGNIVEFILYVNALTWPIASLGWVTSLIQRAAASQSRINEFLKIQPNISVKEEISGSEKEDAFISEISDIEFREVSFQYGDSDTMALKNISFKIKAGSSFAIIGRTGSGKSTIASLICRLYDASSGEVLINSTNVKGINLNVLRSNIGYAPQEVFLFSDTIANNISFSVDQEAFDESSAGLLREEVVAAAKNAAIHANILAFPNAYETKVGERGITLSGGQKQRISIARAIIKKPQLLIFDDCLSAIDTETEEEILNNLNQLRKKKTFVIISHRVSSVKSADKIIVLDHGEIVEQGTHKELMDNRASYFELNQMQLLEEEY